MIFSIKKGKVEKSPLPRFYISGIVSNFRC
jgi:hypothetical protein